MDDTRYGNRTSQWFWTMLKNLGLGSMSDEYFDRKKAKENISIFLNREYCPDGTGGLFKLKHCGYDLRDIEIWTQLNWYIETIIS